MNEPFSDKDKERLKSLGDLVRLEENPDPVYTTLLEKVEEHIQAAQSLLEIAETYHNVEGR